MSHYDDHYRNTTRLFVGHLSPHTCARDLESLFRRHGRLDDTEKSLAQNIKFSYPGKFHALPDGLTVSGNHFRRVRDVDMKLGYAFVDFSDPRDADDARFSLNGLQVHGRRIVVELAKGLPRGPGGVREHVGRGFPPGSGRCFNCGLYGHWARDCKAGDWKKKCDLCGERGHIERNCKNSPKKLRERRYSRSPVRSRSPLRRRRRGRSYSRSVSPPARDRVIAQRRSRSPDFKSGSPGTKSSPMPDKGDIRGTERSSPRREGSVLDNCENSRRTGARSRSPVISEKGGDTGKRSDDGPFDANGVSRNPSPKEDRSPIDDADERRSPRGGE